MKCSEFFDRIYVINLPHRSDRRKLIEQELIAAGMPLAPGKVELFPGIRPESAGEFDSIGSRGAFLSHLSILKQAQKDQVQSVLVIEDDLTLLDAFYVYEKLLIEQLSQQRWGIVHFGYEPQFEKGIADAETPAILKSFSGELVGLHFYGVNGAILDSLIEYLELTMQRPGGHPEGGSLPVDGAINMFCDQNPSMTRLISIPCLGKQRSSRSDISSRWFDRVPVLSELVNTARYSGLPGQIKQMLTKV